MDQFTKFTQGISQNLSPFAEKVGANFTQFRQLASEKLGATIVITELPRDYIELENRFEGIRNIHLELIKYAKIFSHSDNSMDLKHIQTQLRDLTTNIGDKINTMAGTSRAMSPPSSGNDSITTSAEPQTPYHAVSQLCIGNSEKIGLEEPLGAGLYKFGAAFDKIGDSRLRMNNDIRLNVVAALQSELSSKISIAQKLRKDVQGARLALDASKSSLKSATPAKENALRIEVEKSEDVFVTVVEDAMKQMRSVLESPDVIQSVSALASAQLEYYKEAQNILSSLIPELDEIRLTQDALYNHEADS
ncbi:Protein GVP36 [Smittium culicis]|uniref:Protein GVP36 n=1 Tax=Smittium culicis TaxID=133412 RepID=A0A1R1YDQ5_9FUNG|nr:Protein GVP36 [Smittium culicis]